MKSHIVTVTVFCFLLPSLLLVGATLTQGLDADVIELKKACELLSETPQDKTAIKTLQDYAENTNGIDRLRSRCMVGYGLSTLFTGDTNGYLKVRESHAQSYPDDTHLFRVDLESFYAHSKTSDVNSVEFKPPLKVIDEFTLVAKGMVKWISNEEVFYDRYAAAKDETNVVQRVAALRALLSNYSYRDDKDEIEKILAIDQASVKALSTIGKEQAAREKHELMVLLNLKGSGNPVAAMEQINDYLKEHPDSENRVELQSIMDGLTEELEAGEKRHRVFYMLGALLLVIFGLSWVTLKVWR